MRLDLAVVARGLARSRTHAQALISSGAVLVDGSAASKASLTVHDDAVIELAGPADHYVSRAAHKLIGALNECEPIGLAVAGRVALDAGASTGGFTQVLLERGARHVTAVDVGHDQLHADIRADARVTVVEGVNVRDLEHGSLRADTDLVVADLSFISLGMVIPSIVVTVAPASDFLLMVKPQFEVGRQRLGKNGVVTVPQDRADAVAGVVRAMRSSGLAIHHVSRSELPGPHGNVEYFVWGSTAWHARDVGGVDHNGTNERQGARSRVGNVDLPGEEFLARPVLDDSACAAAIAREVAKG